MTLHATPDYAQRATRYAREEAQARQAALLALDRVEVLERELAESDARTLRLVRPWHPEPPDIAA